MRIIFVFLFLVYCDVSREEEPSQPASDDQASAPTPIRTLKPIKPTVYVPSAPVCEGTIYECLVEKKNNQGQPPAPGGSSPTTDPSTPPIPPPPSPPVSPPPSPPSSPVANCEGSVSDCGTNDFSWLVSANTEKARISITDNKVIWISGTWHGGDWYGDVWQDGLWHDGVWHGGVWNAGFWRNGTWKAGDWKGGTWGEGHWYTGNWHQGYWRGGAWYGGVWHDGIWYAGIWSGGHWKNGEWWGGVWGGGTWDEGRIYKWNADESNYFITRSYTPPL